MKEMIPKNSALVDGDDLTFNYHDEAFTDSLKLSMGAKISHKAVIQLITTHIDDISEFGRVAFQMEPFATKGGVQKNENLPFERGTGNICYIYDEKYKTCCGVQKGACSSILPDERANQNPC